MFENIFKGLEFGKDDNVKTSIYGPAFYTNEKKYISYDKNTDNYVDVTDLLIDIDSMNYKMPVAANMIAVGDYIKHSNVWVKVITVYENGNLEVEDSVTREVKTVFPVKSVFGFNFYVKLYCFAENFLSSAADENNPFGNLLPLALLSNKDSNDNLLPLMLMSGGNYKDMNPMMLYALMSNKNSDNSNFIMLYMLMNNEAFGNIGDMMPFA